jgi:hypothetical protein
MTLIDPAFKGAGQKAGTEIWRIEVHNCENCEYTQALFDSMHTMYIVHMYVYV